MNPILRNLISVARRFKLAATLNILGLSVAFAAFMVIMIQLNYDYGFDKFHKDSNKIFRVECYGSDWVGACINRPLAERFFDSSPHIVAGGLTQMSESESFVHVEEEGERNHFKEKSLAVTPEFFDVFTFDFVEGSADDYIAPGNVFIPLSLKRKLFGNEPAVGRQIVHSNWGNQTVLAVYRDFPANSIIHNCMYFAMHPNENKESWRNNNYYAYIRVNHPANASQLFDNFKRNFDAQAVFGPGFEWDNSTSSMRLTALPDIHFTTDVQYDNTPKGSKQTLAILFVIAIVIIAIAGINFTNFSTALTPMRVKSINTQRVLGARQRTIRMAIVFEAVAISMLSYLIALWFVEMFQRTSLARLVVADLSLVANPMIVGGVALVALFTGLFAGVYPARFMTSFAPAFVLKGSFGLSPKGNNLRNALISIQFITSFALIIGASFMFLQNHFMRNSPLGYDKDELLVTNIGMIRASSRDAFINQIKSYSGIEDITFGESLLSSSDQYMGWGGQYKGEGISFQALPVHHTFLNVLGIDIIEGRDFRPEDANRQYGVFVFNETAQKRYNLEVGETVENRGANQGEIIGFMPDVKFASFRTGVVPMAFYVWGTEKWGSQSNQAYIKVKAGTNIRAAMSHIYSTLAAFNPEHPFFEVRFFDEVLQRLYEKEIALSSLVSLFSLLAIFISIVGVFGLVVFDSECRRKEIAIRKVFGASTTDIIFMFNKAYIRILAVCFVIATPLAWYAVHRWLENFAYKTPMYWWVYLLAFVAVGVITAGTVTFQNWRVANENPARTIKVE